MIFTNESTLATFTGNLQHLAATKDHPSALSLMAAVNPGLNPGDTISTIDDQDTIRFSVLASPYKDDSGQWNTSIKTVLATYCVMYSFTDSRGVQMAGTVPQEAGSRASAGAQVLGWIKKHYQPIDITYCTA